MFKILYINPELEPSIQASIRKRYQDYLTDNPLLAIVEVSNVEAPKIVNETTEGERLVIPPSLLDSVMEEVLYALENQDGKYLISFMEGLVKQNN